MVVNGSSPRPWGTFRNPSHPPFNARFIPTPVGNMLTFPLSTQTMPVHPHARGEHQLPGLMVSNNLGSSPRPWGTSRCVGDHCGGGRFIPTPVGNIAGGAISTLSASVHPHARGEHASPIISTHVHPGSSPRPWGTSGIRNRCIKRRRFIPTPVGNMRFQRSDRRTGWVHPHARGEHFQDGGRLPQVGGSSPRPWGT